MAQILISALLPIIITLLLGYFAGIRKDLDGYAAVILNKVILKYCLPLSLFGGIVSTKRIELLKNGPVAAWILLGMIGGYLVYFLIAHYGFKASRQVTALRALTISGPAIPFIGPVILGALFSRESALLIGIGSLILSSIQIPMSIVLLTPDTKNQCTSVKNTLGPIFKQGIVWAPLLAFVLSMSGC
ncbi:MAG: AEC family transporter [Liquorilactobacillus sp.]